MSSGGSTYQTSGSGSTGGESGSNAQDSSGSIARSTSTGGSTFQPSGNDSTGGNTNPSGPTSSGSTGGSSSEVPTAPGYVAPVVSGPGNSGKPHGKNITEGGFDVDDSNNASFTSEIGSKNDPGRKAENNFQAQAQSASGGTGPRQYGSQGKGEGTYGVLDTDQSL